MTIDELLDEQGINDVCRECKYLESFTDKHPYGEWVADESTCYCSAPYDPLCPRLEE